MTQRTKLEIFLDYLDNHPVQGRLIMGSIASLILSIAIWIQRQDLEIIINYIINR